MAAIPVSAAARQLLWQTFWCRQLSSRWRATELVSGRLAAHELSRIYGEGR